MRRQRQFLMDHCDAGSTRLNRAGRFPFPAREFHGSSVRTLDA
jgi:hypothetical protein